MGHTTGRESFTMKSTFEFGPETQAGFGYAAGPAGGGAREHRAEE